jgi:type 1 glutamine amidotransferase
MNITGVAMLNRTLAVMTVALGAFSSFSFADQPIPTLIITGHNNHNWQYTSRVHKDTLEATGKFVVDITEDPGATLADAKAIGKYKLFVLDYNDSQAAKRWGGEGSAAEKNFAEAVRGGTGVVAVHAANNAFNGWKEYEQMLGLMWREGTGHGKYHDFDVKIVDKDHPITKGMTDFSKHPDELYHKLVNVRQTSPHILMRAMDDKEFGGTGAEEPMALTIEYGKGRVFATPLGHVWVNDLKSKRSVLDPQFRVLLVRGAEWAATGAVTLPATWSDTREHNTLSPEMKKDGWVLLFDGSESSAKANFREYKGKEFPAKGWAVRDGAIMHAKGGEGGDIVSAGEYGDFEFTCQWRITSGGNSGIMYHVTEDHGAPYETGPEMQILDDEVHADSAKGKTRAGAMYDLFACAADVCRPAGEWNTVRIAIKGSRHQYWLNGVQVIDVDCAGEAYKKAHAESKWKTVPDFNARAKGHIDLQNHGDEVWFRDLKVRPL